MKRRLGEHYFDIIMVGMWADECKMPDRLTCLHSGRAGIEGHINVAVQNVAPSFSSAQRPGDALIECKLPVPSISNASSTLAKLEILLIF